jgi:hypothetical protein
MTTAANPYPLIELPPGAVAGDEWGDVGKPDAFRIFTGPRHRIGEYFIEACGTQSVDGSIDGLYIRTNLHWDDEIRGAAPRQIAQAFDQAADDLQRIARQPG